MQIKNSKILITGANRGIGLEIAKMCAIENAHLHLVMRKDDSQIKTELLNLGALSIQIWQADLGSREGTEKLLAQIKEIDVDILINNAGQLTGGLIENQTLDEIYSMFQVNLLSLIQLTRGLLPSMIKKGRGKIVNNSSVSAFMHFPCASTYAASKAALVAFNNCIAGELAPTGVSTLCLITPGIKTRMFDEIETKYSQNFDIPQNYISAEAYAQKIKKAILDDENFLYPQGITGVGVSINKYLPKLFNWEIGRRFKR